MYRHVYLFFVFQKKALLRVYQRDMLLRHLPERGATKLDVVLGMMKMTKHKLR